MTKLSEMFTVKSRFHRSVQIEYDRALEDYILTQVGVKTVRRIVESFDDSLATKAWSVVGPYGSGKSAFILYLKTLLGPSNDSTTIHARKLLKTKEKKLHEKLFVNRKRFKANSKGFCRALVCAGRERLEYAILKGLYNGVDEFFKLSTTRKQPQILTSLSEALNKANKGKYPSNDEIINFCKEAVQYVKKSKGEGIVLVVDELGKTLENAALDQENDIFIL
ncbi:hypothetical protein KAR91_60775, partial [Candidatus Pacearchaeota archaeon]|nr:hypothetical protein [Candidatus Pacearchaeota archaeon]